MLNFGENETYILGCPLEDGTVAILCRTSGEIGGPACCDNRREAVKLKTKLANDPRGMDNHRAMEIIKGLLIYKVAKEENISWETGALWAYLPIERVKCVESEWW